MECLVTAIVSNFFYFNLNKVTYLLKVLCRLCAGCERSMLIGLEGMCSDDSRSDTSDASVTSKSSNWKEQILMKNYHVYTERENIEF